MLHTPQPSIAYVDGSALLSIIFEESAAPLITRRLAQFSQLISSTLLEAEVRAALYRAGQSYDPRWLSDIVWIYPVRSLSAEIAATLRVRHLRSGDLLHVATALYASQARNAALAFITLDQNQRDAAVGLGFAT